MALLDVSGVTLRYKTSSAVVTATERVSFAVDKSDRFVLLGPSGCGKSTLLKAVGGYMSPSEGRMTIGDREIHGPGADRMMIFQEFDQLLPWKSVLANVMFPLLTRAKAVAQGRRRAGAGLYREGRPHPRRRCLSAHAVRRHEAARRDRARHGDGA